MKDYKLNLTFFLSAIAIISIFVIGISLLIGKENYSVSDFTNLILNYGIVTIPLTLIWLFFEKIGWRCKYFKWLRKSLNFPPDLRGRWEGTLDRIDENNPHKFVIEIKQTMTKIQINAYSRRGMSESIVDAICTDKMEDDFTLCYLWEGEAGKLSEQINESGKFKGYTILKFINTKEGKKLNGDYFTNRKPLQTIGKIDVDWHGFDLLKTYGNKQHT